MVKKQWYVYILTNNSSTLYVGVTNDLERRVHEHKQKLVPGFTSQYNVSQLVYYEAYDSPVHAVEREKQLKNWRREKKVALIRAANPRWLGLAAEWSGEEDERSPR